MNLLDLPCEILLSVAEQCDDPRDILSFACLTRATYNILQKLLFRPCAQQQNCIALHYAAKYNNYDIARTLLRYGASVNSRLMTSTALIVAAAFGSESVMDLLLTQENIDVNIRNMHGETAMWRAAYAGRGSAVERLLQRNDLEIDVPDTFHGITPFALAVANGNISIAKALLDTNRVNINFRDAWGRTPLHYAVLSKHKPSVLLLLDTNRVNINFRDAQGRTPLHHAVPLKHKPSVLLLLSRKEIDIQIQDENQCTPLWCATECGNLDAAQLLLMYGANPNIRDYHRVTPLNNAIWRRDTAMVELLLNQGDLKISPHVGWAEHAQPPLCAAVCVGDANILRMLLCHMAEGVNAYNYDGYQPLLLAVRRGDSSMVKLLLSHKDIDVNKRGRGRYGFTALHQAAYDGCLSILNMLLAHPGTDINAKDEWGTTPLWWATKSGHCLVVKRLLAESTLELDGFVELLSPLHHCR
ncbi:hypothetical protein IFM60648_10288 [Aspergillus lentulus]|uniref:Uncharacterized protein n=1 Tax=Aspergillus lentulus TaxID=293939 RepID=A0ABQ1B5G3_ASPLE|nr:hypothetical protein IFM60648_10288 [Aspergillus lentulus]